MNITIATARRQELNFPDDVVVQLTMMTVLSNPKQLIHISSLFSPSSLRVTDTYFAYSAPTKRSSTLKFNAQEKDVAARSAHDGARCLAIPLSSSDAAKELREIARRLTLDLWNSSPFSSARFQALDPNLQLRIPTDFSRHYSILLVRLWVGVVFSNAYSFTIGMTDSPLCEHCGSTEMIAHLYEYARFNAERAALSATLVQMDNRPFTENKILGHWTTKSSRRVAVSALLRFLRQT